MTSNNQSGFADRTHRNKIRLSPSMWGYLFLKTGRVPLRLEIVKVGVLLCPNTRHVGLHKPDLLAISIHKPRCFSWTWPFGNIHTLAKVLFMNLTLWPCPNTWYVGLQEPDLLAISVHKPRCFYELDPLALSLHLACWFTWARPLWQYPYTSQGAFMEPDPLVVSIHLNCWLTWTRPFGKIPHKPRSIAWSWSFGNVQVIWKWLG